MCKKFGCVKCKSFTLTLDLHAIYTAIDTYSHNIGQHQMKGTQHQIDHFIVCIG
jgi:hypothetical protein